MKLIKPAQTLRSKTAIAAALAALASPSFAQLILEEVIVTAQKRTETLQDVSATVNVLSGNAIDKFSALNFGDLETQTAGLTLASPNARSSSISMRGIGTDPEAGATAAVTVYWNDGDIRQDIAFSQLYDLERLEILRGPQGTLQGATSPAGAINILTKRPDLSESAGYVQLTAGSNDGLNTQVAWGGPIVEGKFAARIAAVYDQSFANDVENLTTGFDEPEAEAKSARITTIWAVTEDLEATLTWQWLDRENDDVKAMSGSDPQGIRPTLSAADRQGLGKSDDFGNLEYDIANLILDWQIGDLELVSVTAYTDSDKLSGTENDRANYVTNPEALTNQTANTLVDSISQELRLSSSDNDSWDWMVGAYYRDQETVTAFNANTTVDGVGISFFSEGAIPVDAKESALFTFNTFYLSPTTQLEVGLRWTDYEGFRAGTISFGGINFLPAAFEPIKDIVIAGFAANFPIQAVSPENETTKEDAITGSVKLRWDYTDDISVYGAYNRGYRRSGISILPDPDIVFLPNGEDDLIHDEEKSDSFELGFKSRLMGGRATLNGAVYYQKFDGYLGFVRGVQVLDDTGTPVDLSGGIIYNGDAILYGMEFEGRILLSETWNAGGSFSYSKGEWDGAEAPCNVREPGEVLGLCDIDGDPISGEPEVSVTLNTEYYWNLENSEVYLRGLYKWSDERLNQEASAGIGDVTETFESYGTLNLYTGWRSTDLSWDVSLWVKNATDEDEINFQQGPDQYDTAFTGGSYTQTNTLQERTYGLTARYNF